MDIWPVMSVSRYVLVLFPASSSWSRSVAAGRWLHRARCALRLQILATLFYQYVHFRFIA